MTIGLTGAHDEPDFLTSADVIIPLGVLSDVQHVVAIHEDASKAILQWPRILFDVLKIETKVREAKHWEAEDTSHQLSIPLVNVFNATSLEFRI